MLLKVFGAVWQWLKTDVWRTISAFVGGLVVIFGIAYLVQRSRAKRARDEAAIARIQEKVVAFQSKSEALSEEDQKDEVVATTLEAERAQLKEEIEAAQDTTGMTQDEVLDAFAQLGY